MSVIGRYPEFKSSYGRVGQLLVNAVTVQVKSAQNDFSGKATYQDLSLNLGPLVEK